MSNLCLSNLGDPVVSRGHKNLSLAALVESLEDAGESLITGKLRPLVDTFDSTCKKLRHRRNKWIGHFDLRTMLGSKMKPLEGPSRTEIETALEALHKVMNCVELHYSGGETKYEHFEMDQAGECLVLMLRQSLRYRELVKEKIIARDDLAKNL